MGLDAASQLRNCRRRAAAASRLRTRFEAAASRPRPSWTPYRAKPIMDSPIRARLAPVTLVRCEARPTDRTRRPHDRQRAAPLGSPCRPATHTAGPGPQHGAPARPAGHDDTDDRVPRPRLREDHGRGVGAAEARLRDGGRSDAIRVGDGVRRDGGWDQQPAGARRHGDHVRVRLLRTPDGGHGRADRRERSRARERVGQAVSRERCWRRN